MTCEGCSVCVCACVRACVYVCVCVCVLYISYREKLPLSNEVCILLLMAITWRSSYGMQQLS